MKAVAFVVAAALVCAVAFADCSLTTGESADLDWRYESGTLTFTRQSETRGDMQNYTSSGLPDWSECADDITKVVFKDGAKCVGAYAFYGMNKLEEISIPDSLETIGAGAFQGCSALKKLVIPGSVSEIGNSAFSGCGILNISINCNNCNISANAFNSPDLNTVVIKGKKICQLNAGAFTDCPKLQAVTLPPFSLDDEFCPYNISSQAFQGCTDLSLVYYMGKVDPCGGDKDREAFDDNCATRYVVVPTYYSSKDFCGKHAKIVSTTTDGASVVSSALVSVVMLLALFLFQW